MLTTMVSVSSLSELPSVTLMITVQSLLSAPAPHGVSSKSTALVKVSAPLRVDREEGGVDAVGVVVRGDDRVGLGGRGVRVGRRVGADRLGVLVHVDGLLVVAGGEGRCGLVDVLDGHRDGERVVVVRVAVGDLDDHGADVGVGLGAAGHGLPVGGVGEGQRAAAGVDRAASTLLGSSSAETIE